MENPYISIIIPVYNAQEYIQQCIESTIQQTLSNIEIILVDDCSLDRSSEIIETFIAQDKRIRLLKHDRNMGEMKARSTGVMAAQGQYIIFLDNDDELDARACEKLYESARLNKADIYGFGTLVVCPDDQSRTKAQEYYKNYSGYIYGKDILKKGFVERVMTRNIFDKMYTSGICKKAHKLLDDSQIEADKSPIGVDSYAFLVIAFFADSFFGIEDKLYKYYYGRGIMGRSKLSLERFERFCMSAICINNCRNFFLDRGVLEQYTDVLNSFYMDLINTCTAVWRDQIPRKDKKEALQIMMSYWSHTDLLMRFASILEQYLHLNEICSLKSWKIPYSLLPKKGNIVLYGAGDVGKDYFHQISDSGLFKVVLWVDRDYLSLQDNGLQVNSPDEIIKVNFDCVLIAVLDNSAALAIKNFLTESLNISKDLIIWHDPREER